MLAGAGGREGADTSAAPAGGEAAGEGAVRAEAAGRSSSLRRKRSRKHAGREGPALELSVIDELSNVGGKLKRSLQWTNAEAAPKTKRCLAELAVELKDSARTCEGRLASACLPCT